MEFVIPEELLVNILVRLPLKDIFRYKLVCKSWLRLISSSSDPYFRINYARNSPFTLIFRVHHDVDNRNKLFYSLIEFAVKGGGEITHHHIPITPPEIPDLQNNNISSLSFVGSCNASAFILHQKRLANDHEVHRVYSFNPVSGSCVNLVVEDKYSIWEPTRKYMVGFIPSNNTCKLLRFGPGVEKAEIFTVGLDENWRKVEDPLLFCGAKHYKKEESICFNGAYHWLSYRDCDRIFTFNLLEEKSGTRIPIPHGMSQRLSYNTTRLTILEDRLSVVELSENEHHSSYTMVVWTMREYGVVESWSKLFVLPLYEKWRPYCLPIAVFANGDILFSEKYIFGGMCFYNLQERRLTPIPGTPFKVYENTYVPRFCT